VRPRAARRAGQPQRPEGIAGRVETAGPPRARDRRPLAMPQHHPLGRSAGAQDRCWNQRAGPRRGRRPTADGPAESPTSIVSSRLRRDADAHPPPPLGPPRHRRSRMPAPRWSPARARPAAPERGRRGSGTSVLVRPSSQPLVQRRASSSSRLPDSQRHRRSSSPLSYWLERRMRRPVRPLLRQAPGSPAV